ncbi:MAG: type III secretion system export apparatus subunit SctR [Pseudomonadota bacterium]
MPTFDTAPSSLFIILIILGLVPFLAVMTTAFVKIAVVLLLLRNALGVQGIPPNMAIYGLAIILTIYIMSPVGQQAFDIAQNYNLDTANIEELQESVKAVAEPFRQFLEKHAEVEERKFFVDSAKLIWPKESYETINKDSYIILIPAFAISELTTAFEIGFLLYLPFVVIDLIISNILLAMGMMMVSPMTISLPFKLLLFVLVDGWARLIHGLVLTYQ